MFDFLKRKPKKEQVAPQADMPPIPEAPKFSDEPDAPDFNESEPIKFESIPEPGGFSELDEQKESPMEPPTLTEEIEEPKFDTDSFNEKASEDVMHDLELPKSPEELPGADFADSEPKMQTRDVPLFDNPPSHFEEMPEKEHEAMEMLEPSEGFKFDEPDMNPQEEHKEEDWKEVKWAEEAKQELVPEQKPNFEQLELPAPEHEEEQEQHFEEPELLPPEEPEVMNSESQEQTEEPEPAAEIEPEPPIPKPSKSKKELGHDEDYELPDFDESVEVFDEHETPTVIRQPSEEIVLPEIADMAAEDIYISTDDYHKISLHFSDLMKGLSKSYNALGGMTRISDEQKVHFETLFSHINQAQDNLINIDRRLFEKR